MKKYIILILLSVACSPSKKNVDSQIVNCNENLKFKKEFFKNIENIESHITTIKDDSYDDSLKFITKYVHVSYDDMLNYAHVYTTAGFEADKKAWLKWYEENKCSNIQFKK